MERASYDTDCCSFGRTLALIGDRWSMLILREEFFGVRRFDDLQRNLGIARNILTGRLHNLVDCGILERRLYQDRPRRFEYRLSQKGIDLYPALVALMEWGDRYVADEPGPPLVLRHKRCGQRTRPTLTCSACGEDIDARDMEPEPGPGAVSLTA
jgi:DNA-binding HxlR family transcriptional regulator